MSTPCESVYDVFFDLIEEDRDMSLGVLLVSLSSRTVW